MKSKKDPVHERDPTRNPLTIEFDAKEFAHYLEECDLTEDEKIEYLKVIWGIVLQFVDLGFGLHPIQQACGQDDEICLKSALTAPDSVYSDYPILSEDFEAAGLSLRCKAIPDMHTEREEEI